MTDTVRSASYFLNLLHPNIPNATPDATVMEAQLARDLVVSIPQLGSPATFYVDGTNYALTRTGLQAAITAAGAAGGGRVLITGNLTLDTTSITFPATGNIELSAVPGVTIKAPASGAVNMILGDGTFGATSALTANTARYDYACTHTPADAARVMAIGDIIRIDDSTGMSHNARVTAVSASSIGVPQTVTFDYPLSYAFLTANTSTIRKVTMIPNLYLHDMSFDVNGNTGVVRCIVMNALSNARFERLNFSGFAGSGVTGTDQANAFTVYGSLNPYFGDLYFRLCGTSVTSAMQNSNNTGSISNRIFFTHCGVAYNDAFSNHMTLQSVKSEYHYVRGVNIGYNAQGFSCFDVTMFDCWGNHGITLGTGLAFRGGSAYVRLFGCGAIGNNTGVYIVGTVGTPEHDIRDYGGYYLGNATYDVDVDANSTTPYAVELNDTKYSVLHNLSTGLVANQTLLNSSGTSIVNSVTRTAIATVNLYPGQLNLNNAIEGVISGLIVNNAGNRTITFEFQFGAAAQIVKATAAFAASAAGRPFEIRFSIRNSGATNSQAVKMSVEIGLPTAGGTGNGDLTNVAPFLRNTLQANPAVDSTAAQTLAIYATCSANDFTVGLDTVIMRMAR